MLRIFVNRPWLAAAGPARASAALMAAVLATGCASFGAAHLVSVPTGAEVINLEDDSILGTTPVRVSWQAKSSDPQYISVRFQRPGFRDKITAFWVNMRHGSRESALSNAGEVKVELEKKGGAR